MEKLLLVLLLVLFVSVVHSCSVDKDELKEKIDLILKQKITKRMTWGISFSKKVNGTYEILYERNSGTLLVPASNNKLITTSAAFLALGKDFVWNTVVVGNDRGDLCIVGGGDASFGFDQLKDVALQVSKRVQNFRYFYYDDVFPVFPAEWEFDDLIADYGAQPSSFVLEENTVTISVFSQNIEGRQRAMYSFKSDYDYHCISVVNSVSISDTTSLSAHYVLGDRAIVLTGTIKLGDKRDAVLAVNNPVDRYICVFQQMLKNLNVSVDNFSPRKCDSQTYGIGIATISSPPISVTMNHTLQISDNLYTENYQRTLGLKSPEFNGNAQLSGIQYIKKILSEKGLDPESYHQHDGSGLSRHNLVSNEALVQLLISMEKVVDFNIYKSFLPVAARSGSLKNRFIGTVGEGIIHAKTGSEEGVNSLSGYIDYDTGFIFSILSNGATAHASEIRNIIDELVLLLITECH